MSVTGEPGGEPVKCGIPVGDLSAGPVLRRRRSSPPTPRASARAAASSIDTSLFEGALALSIWETAELWATGRVPAPLGSAHRLTAPYQALRTRDGHITVGGNNERLWERLCDAIGREDLPRRPAASPPTTTRMEHRPALVGRARGDARRARHGRLGRDAARGRRAGRADPRLRAGRSTTRTRSRARWWPRWSTRSRARSGRWASRSSSPTRRGTIRRAAPLLGEHTEEVLRQAGLDDARGRGAGTGAGRTA